MPTALRQASNHLRTRRIYDMPGKKRKVRVDFQKNRERRSRRGDLTREVVGRGDEPDQEPAGERMSGKGALSRRRTIIVDDEPGNADARSVDREGCLSGRVLRSVGLNALVETDHKETYECAVRRVLRTMARDARNALVCGDRVLLRPSGHVNESGLPQAVVEQVRPRRGVVSRSHNNREHIIAANIDQALIVASAAEPPFKPGLVDRFLISCEKGAVTPLVCINKADLGDEEALASLVYRYRNLGYEVLLTSATEGWGIEPLRARLRDRITVLAGQSGVGKSSLLNAVDVKFDLPIGAVSAWSMKGKHTTRRAELLPLAGGGYVIDTPGIRQFQPWEVDPGEIEGLFVEFVRYVPQCRFADCSHRHESGCAVKQAVALGMISEVRYASYQRIFEGLLDD